MRKGHHRPKATQTKRVRVYGRPISPKKKKKKKIKKKKEKKREERKLRKNKR